MKSHPLPLGTNRLKETSNSSADGINGPFLEAYSEPYQTYKIELSGK